MLQSRIFKQFAGLKFKVIKACWWYGIVLSLLLQGELTMILTCHEIRFAKKKQKEIEQKCRSMRARSIKIIIQCTTLPHTQPERRRCCAGCLYRAFSVSFRAGCSFCTITTLTRSVHASLLIFFFLLLKKCALFFLFVQFGDFAYEPCHLCAKVFVQCSPWKSEDIRAVRGCESLWSPCGSLFMSTNSTHSPRIFWCLGQNATFYATFLLFPARHIFVYQIL